jgi:hypothetical protein
MAWLLDTNVLSELRRPKPDARVVAFVAGRPLDQLQYKDQEVAVVRSRQSVDIAAGQGGRDQGSACFMKTALAGGGATGSARGDVGSQLSCLGNRWALAGFSPCDDEEEPLKLFHSHVRIFSSHITVLSRVARSEKTTNA